MVILERINKIFKENEGTRPKYRRLYQTIEECVESEVFGPGERVPSERALAEGLGISRVTVRKAFSELFQYGMLDRKHGAGTYVPKPIEKSVSSVASFTEDMARHRLTPSSKTVSVKKIIPDAHLDLVFRLEPGQSVIEIRRIRYANDFAIAYEVVIVPDNVLPDLQNIGQSLYKDMEQMGYRPSSAVQRIKALNANKIHAAMLDINPGAAILHIERHGVVENGSVVEYTNSYYRSDSYEFVTKSTL